MRKAGELAPDLIVGEAGARKRPDRSERRRLREGIERAALA
jgi:hypothetical protein